MGYAVPQAFSLAVSASLAVERVGMPEAQIILAQAVIHIATAPKSNSVVTAIGEAMEAVKNEKIMPVPVYLQDSHYRGAQKLGHGDGYQYPHDFPKHYVRQQYLPDNLAHRRFYHMSDQGYEKDIQEFMTFLKK